MHFDLRKDSKSRFRSDISVFRKSLKNTKFVISTLKKHKKLMNFMIFDEFVKSEVSLRNRDLESFLRSKCIEKYLFGKLRVRAFQRLKNQRLATSPSRVMAIWKFYKILKIVRKCIKFNNNLVVNGRRFGGQRPFTK